MLKGACTVRRTHAKNRIGIERDLSILRIAQLNDYPYAYPINELRKTDAWKKHVPTVQDAAPIFSDADDY